MRLGHHPLGSTRVDLPVGNLPRADTKMTITGREGEGEEWKSSLGAKPGRYKRVRGDRRHGGVKPGEVMKENRISNTFIAKAAQRGLNTGGHPVSEEGE